MEEDKLSNFVIKACERDRIYEDSFKYIPQVKHKS